MLITLDRDQLEATGQSPSQQESEEAAVYRARETVLPLARAHERPAAPHRKRWGVVLAGGDGARLTALTKLISGDARPKQFCPLFFDGQTLLAHALRRAELLIPSEQVLVSLTGHHCKWYMEEDGLREDQRIVQPANRGTAPPIAHSILSIAQIDPDAVVAIFPSDHHYVDELLFATQLESAFATAAKHGSVVLMGARPDSPEVGYGWIELGMPVEHRHELYRVQGFREKPSMEIARKLLTEGCVWNTFVMVGPVRAFLEMLQSALPDLMNLLRDARLWKGEETHIEYSLYQQMPPTDFSHQVLSVEAARLLTMRLGPVGWSDLGDPERVLATASAIGRVPGWAEEWTRRKGAGVAVLRPSEAVA